MSPFSSMLILSAVYNFGSGLTGDVAAVHDVGSGSVSAAYL